MKYRTIQGSIGLNFCHVDYYGLFDSPATIKSTIPSLLSKSLLTMLLPALAL
jgi:hypothetical protein